ncbi:hypothetical protein [Marinomonas sp.]|uniref:hypothetical protein n=1 Tax=Marinomonas sp. TaxID=1904862 RepID=UPI003BAA56A7
MTKKDRILLISYFYGTKGCCPAEWADDKVDAISKIGNKIILLTNISSKKNESKGVIHYRIPSLSIQDLKHELAELKNEKMDIPYIQLFLFMPFAITLGYLLDLLQKIITSGNGGGKWSWAFPASVCALYLAIRYNCRTIFTTGGPASAHLAGVFVSLLTGKKLICELQDPLSGKDIGRTANSSKLLSSVEKIIMNAANKVVFVTKNAAAHAKNKYKNVKAEIVAIYPGSKFFLKSENNILPNKLTMIHLGTLYSTRNFNTLIQAIDELIEEGLIDKNQIEILNLGEIHGDIKEHHLSRSYIKQESIKPREEAIHIASTYMVSLLIQHSDSRSEATIPYKTYDYINIGNPILALTNSDELSDLLRKNNHVVADVKQVTLIKKTLVDLLQNYNEFKANINPLAVDIISQTILILDRDIT